MSAVAKVVLLAAVGAVALLGTPASASAETLDCTLDGVTGTNTPAVRAVLSGSGGVGTYTFDGGVTCLHSGGDVQQGSFSTSGTYDYTLCGNGTWDGTATVSLPRGSATLRYRADFRAMQGLYDVYEVDGRSERRAVDVSTRSTAADYDGAISTRPASGNCVTSDVPAWSVLWQFSIAW